MNTTQSGTSTSRSEDEFVLGVREFLSRPDYLIPLVAAERQYRDHYYGLNAAALLEDLFVDALSNFLRQTKPSATLARPPVGQKGWDYKFNGINISHKISQKVGTIAALWDATKKGVTTWSFKEPITYVLASTSPAILSATLPDGTTLKARTLAGMRDQYSIDGAVILVVRWPSSGTQARLLKVVETKPGDFAQDALPFEAIWEILAEAIANGSPANEIDVLVTNSRRVKRSDLAALHKTADIGGCVEVSAGSRSGVYLFSHDMLQNLKVETNNRGILIPRSEVTTLLNEAVARENFVPMPLWYWAYAARNSPDMYATQRVEYDARFRAGLRE